jgi:hypothetical protein
MKSELLMASHDIPNAMPNAIPNAHLMSRLDKPFQCWEPMSQLELKLLPVLLPAQRALTLL